MLVSGQIPMKAELVEGVVVLLKQNVLFTRPTHSGQCLLRLQALDTEPYDIFSKPSYNHTQFQNAIVKLTNNTTCFSPIHARHKLPSLFLGKINKEIMFRDVLNRKQAFLDNKNINPKNVNFFKGGKMSLEIVFHNVLNRKETILE
ncbi:unnamed protein product [Porites evermanni]|uniref:Uncharacterized protein n=1 Tax=Porites evermanni TaxID=104178 RepID=A0ABN8M3W8_9CNID|nr:unnamed protein product [Porites evermanni]